MQFRDQASVAGARRTKDGYLVAQVRVARAGNVQVYSGAEMGREDMSIVRVFRPPSTVFDAETKKSFAFRPVTRLHPDTPVTADTWRSVSIGMTGGEIGQQDSFLTVPMVLMDGETIKEVEDGDLREVSCGYSAELRWEPGKTDDGQVYDASVTKITGNHIALVPKGRAGSACRFGDQEHPTFTFDRAAAERALEECSSDTAAVRITASPPKHKGDKPVTAETHTRAVTIDGFKFSVSDQAADLVERLQRQIGDAVSAADALRADHAQRIQSLDGQIGALKATHAEAIQAKDGEVAAIKATYTEAIQAKDGEITALKSQIPDAVALDAMLDSRMACANEAARVHGEGFDPRGKTEAEMRRIAVAKRLGDAVVTPMSDAEVGGAFRALASSAAPINTPDPLRVAISAGGIQAQDSDPRRTAHQEYVHFLENAHLAGKEG